jgi:hypothetical protein
MVSTNCNARWRTELTDNVGGFKLWAESIFWRKSSNSSADRSLKKDPMSPGLSTLVPIAFSILRLMERTCYRAMIRDVK